jgi:hypothetical protein
MDGLLPKPAKYAHAFPDLLTFQHAPTEIVQTLFVMFLETPDTNVSRNISRQPGLCAVVWLE